ncbi:acetyl-CoA synthetase-like protein [Mycena polygramma]|nr:acetyl-CoA synthetase-like protein [Mycena polygramma]
MPVIRPPLDCSLDVDEIIDHHITHNNRSAAYSFGDEAGHITDITHSEVARAAHRVAHLLRPHRRGPESQVVAILALTDVLVYQTIVAGCIKAGLVPFLISHRNSEAVIVHLLKSTGSHRVLTTKGSLGHLVDTVAADLSAVDPSYELTIEEIPLLGQIYPHLGHKTTEEGFIPFPSPATRIPLDNVTMYLHSSGSTGMPKCIPETQRNLIHFASLGCLAQIIEISPRQAHGVLPPFHTGAMLLQLVSPLLNGGTCCIFPPASTVTEYKVPPTPTADNALEYAKRASATGITVAPAFLVGWEATEHVAYLKTLKIVAYAGGPLPTRVGDSLYSQGVNIIPLYGGTEFGPPPDIRKTKADEDAGEWQWFRFSARTNIRWVPEGDGIFELQFLTVPDTHQLAIENLPDVKGYSTKDLFERHPTKPDMYRIVGRLDDVLIMANGEKTVPGPMEDEIMASPMISAAIMFGHERSEVGVLVDPNPTYTVDSNDEDQLAQFRNLIWPVIESANENAPAFAHIYKEMILLMRPEKPIVRTGKGTINKKGTIARYKPEIDNLYETIETSGNAASDIEPPSSWASQDLEPWLQTHVSLVTGQEIRADHDIFDQGFDSLNATFLRHRIVAALRRSADDSVKAAARKIPQNFVYAHPSITELAVAIATLVSTDSDCTDGGKAAVIVENMIAKYSQGFGNPVVHEFPKAAGGLVVLLTGSTGAIASHILEVLLGLPSVDRVYAFNRKSKAPALDRQRAAFTDRALDVNLLSSSKLVYLEGDTSSADLGLPFGVWSTLRDTVTVVIHNAWSLDFNKSLSSFEPHVKGTRNLIDLALQSPHKSGVRFLFTSSIGSAQGWDRERGPFPEEVQFDASVAVSNGYGESKYVSERILAASGLEATSFRIGQVCGSASNGAWSTTDWVPTIVKSSIALGNFPSDPAGVVAWLSPEAVSHTIVDAATSTAKLPFAMNLVHPRPVPWDRMMSTFAREAQLPLIPFSDWVEQVQVHSSAATAEEIDKIPATKLLDFFKAVVAGAGSIEFSTAKAQAMSEWMKSLKPLTEEDAKQWMKYWRRKEFIA